MHAFENELKVSQREHPVLLSEPPLNPKLHRERCCQLFFEAFEVPGLYMAPTSLLALYGSSKTTGLVLDLGEGVAHAVPINEGTVVPHAVGRLDVGGYDVTSFMLASLPGLDPAKVQDRQIAKEIKHNCGYVALDYEQELKALEKNPEQNARRYTLPDGSSISLGNASFQCPEMLLSPEVAGRNAPKMVDVVYHAIRNCEPDMHRALFSNIVLTGGSSLFSGLTERCEKDLRAAVNDNAPVKLAGTIKNRELTVWIGGSIVASLPSFQQMWVTKADYDESGPTVALEAAVLVLFEHAGDEQREDQRDVGVHLDGVRVGLDLAPGDGLVRVRAGVRAVVLLRRRDVHGVVGAVAHQVRVAHVVLRQAAAQDDDARLAAVDRDVVHSAYVAHHVDPQRGGLAAAPRLQPLLEGAVVVVGDEEVADAVEAALAHRGAVHVELADVRLAHALDQVLLHPAAAGDDDVDQLVLGQVDERVAQPAADHVRGEGEPDGALCAFAHFGVLVRGPDVLLGQRLVAQAEL
ncbi:actin, putative [Babesia caballi]|uniref:Actin, putative n=1 Tax=Babesia caballi TaxID=5871 RepID=A0AAV4LU35_BABCB|nr:actin, putative [Babesia caballi]